MNMFRKRGPIEERWCEILVYVGLIAIRNTINNNSNNKNT